MVKLDDSMDETSTGIRIVGPRREVLAATAQGLVRLVGTLTSEVEWVREDLLPGVGPVESVVREPRHRALVAGVGGIEPRLEASVDRGKAWSPVPGWERGEVPLALAATGDGKMLAGTRSGRILVGGIDGGTQYRVALESEAGPDPRVVQFGRNPRKPTQWAAACRGGAVHASMDDGATWRSLSPPWGVSAVLFTLDGTLLALVEGAIQASSDLGTSWAPLESLPGRPSSIARDAAGRLFTSLEAAEGPSLWSSSDGGRTWERGARDRILPASPRGTPGLVADPVRPGVLYLGLEREIWLLDEAGVRRLAGDLPPIRTVLVL